MKAVIFAFALAAIAASDASARTTCSPGLHPVVSAELFFGADIPGGGSVSEADWTNFLDREVTPRFPEGLTTWEADGRWRAPDGRATHERSRVMLLVFTPSPHARARLDALMDAYRTQFHQISVGLVEHRDCARF